jgi:alpha-beta hydrolase superfamily lysophospholipase
MSDLTFQLNAVDGHRIAVYHWPTTGSRGVVHLLHGMAEHGARYAQLGANLNDAGWALVVHDHRGHGLSVSDEMDRGHYADVDGWNKVLADVATVQAWISEQYQGKPHVLAGHSMGSFVALDYAIKHGPTLDGLVLSSTDFKPRWFYRVMQGVFTLEKWRLGGRGISSLVTALTFGKFAKQIPNRRTDYDWLSHDAEEVDKYINDALCGHHCTMQLWSDMLQGLLNISSKNGLRTLDKELPLFMFCGSGDPMNEFGKGARLMQKMLKKYHPENLRIDIYPQGRHELLNDSQREDITNNLISWLTESVIRR